jgi:hypothetical protein
MTKAYILITAVAMFECLKDIRSISAIFGRKELKIYTTKPCSFQGGSLKRICKAVLIIITRK